MTENENEDPEIEKPRDRGILSQADRDYLLGKKDLSDQSQRDTRYRIRNRVENAIIDFYLLNAGLEQNDQKQVFEKAELDDLVEIFHFVHSGIHLSRENSDIDATTELFETLVSEGLNRSLVELDSEHIIHDVEVTVTVDRSTAEVEELQEKFKEGEESYREFQYLVHHGSLTDLANPTEVIFRRYKHDHERGKLEGHIFVVGDAEIDADDYEDSSEFVDELKEAVMGDD